MAKKCIFCGKKPNNKNKEHILPKWLIKLTGDYGRDFYLGADYSDIDNLTYRSFRVASLTFPACEECNTKFAKLESKAKVVIERIIKDDIFEAEYADVLLEWFDKIRVGLWLSYHMLDKNFYNVTPNFYISNRVSKSDRSLYIYKTNRSGQGLNYDGISNPIFHKNPICLNLIINNYCFFNISTDYLNHRRLGFPYPEKMFIGDGVEEGKIGIGEHKPGMNRVLLPVIRNCPQRSNIAIHQSIWEKIPFEKSHNNSYVKDHSYNSHKSKIYLEAKNKNYWLDKEQIHIDGFNEENIVLKLRKSLEIILKESFNVFSLEKLDKEIKQIYKKKIKNLRLGFDRSQIIEKYAYYKFIEENKI